MTETIRWGIIGVGDVTEVKSGPALQQTDRSEVVAVMRRNGDLAADYARRHGVPTWTDDADALITNPDVNAVYIATPPNAHRDYVLRVVAAGKPVYVEKPFGRNIAEAQEMVDASLQAGVPLFVAYYRRALPRFLKVRDLLSEIGTVRTVTLTLNGPAKPENYVDQHNLPWRVVPELAGGGLFVDLGSHQLDLLDYLLGPVRDVSAHTANLGGYYPAEDTVTASLVFESGVQMTGSWCFVADASRDEIRITGEHGTIHFSTFADAPVRLETSAGTESFEVENPKHIQAPLIQSVVDALLGTGVCPSVGTSALRTNAVMSRILQS